MLLGVEVHGHGSEGYWHFGSPFNSLASCKSARSAERKGSLASIVIVIKTCM